MSEFFGVSSKLKIASCSNSGTTLAISLAIRVLVSIQRLLKIVCHPILTYFFKINEERIDKLY
ncbi:Uncharacterised protein [Chlamydia trachomatis]|nr:Uncharacterised protein [Chlamydia trachomatis]